MSFNINLLLTELRAAYDNAEHAELLLREIDKRSAANAMIKAKMLIKEAIVILQKEND